MTRKGSDKRSRWDYRRIVAWDGEGANLVDGEHVYNLLANSHGRSVINHEGLDTNTCLDFFLRDNDPHAINVIYGGSYDVNMILKDLSDVELETLLREGACSYDRYILRYAHRKKFTVATREQPELAFALWDVLGFFQSTFVNACRKWLGDLPVLDDIGKMKNERDVFSINRIEAIKKYNRTECDLLVQLVTRLFEVVDEVELKLDRYDGAGALAGALLKKHGVREHKGDYRDERNYTSHWDFADPYGESVQYYAQCAYGGGRIEAVKLGDEQRDIYRYDINSAYPYSALALPSYKGAKWHLDPTWDGGDHSLVHVMWSFPDDMPFYPLFYREHDDSILYPQVGEGVYFGVELHALDPRHYQVVQSYNVTLANSYRPFGFMTDLYEQRKAYKAKGDMAQEALKLAMNSTYGKLAQQVGFHGTGDKTVPSSHQLLWAGEITARTRAQMYRAALQKPKAVIAFATDAIITTEPLDLPTNDGGLGGWEPEYFTGITMIQAGVYFLHYPDGTWGEKYRGFDRNTINRQDVIAKWQQQGIHNHNEETCDECGYHAQLTRFMTLGGSMSQSGVVNRDKWRHWITAPRLLNIQPTGKRIAGPDRDYSRRLCDTRPRPNLAGSFPSKAFALEWVEGNFQASRIGSDGVDIRQLEEDLADSFT